MLLDTLLSLDHRQPHYLGTSLNHWPGYHHHFTGMSMGFIWSLLKTPSAGIGKMSREAIETWDEDVLMGELMVARHSKWFKPSDGYEREWGRRIKGRVWKLPAWLDQYADEEAR
ncbi:hypothetical protein EHS25_005705 [Saitozyma podzolica]|uniref:Uncharacterized protein n=1 Tax=Saitozyma podzolica TaxID=1890683 RepID=A0A427XWA1_9TREE|nr:hypothetical protein EHS25_005705 [Saitozyma podzolica]